MTNADLAEIQHLLNTAYCNPLWRKHVTSLTQEVQRLKKMLAENERLDHSLRLEKQHDFNNDTVIL